MVKKGKDNHIWSQVQGMIIEKVQLQKGQEVQFLENSGSGTSPENI